MDGIDHPDGPERIHAPRRSEARPVLGGVELRWRDTIDDDEVSSLHAAAFGSPTPTPRWSARLEHHSLGWASAHDADGRLVGFANVAWDGGEHAFLIDVMVDPASRRAGVATAVVELAIRAARTAGCRWLHVDFEPHLDGLYLGRAGFDPTTAGIIDLQRDDPGGPR